MHKVLSIAILFLATKLLCFSDGLDRNVDQQRFADLLAKIKPWESGWKEEYKVQDWDQLVAAARTMQTFDPSSVQNVLQEWQTNYAEQVKFDWSGKAVPHSPGIRKLNGDYPYSMRSARPDLSSRPY